MSERASLIEVPERGQIGRPCARRVEDVPFRVVPDDAQPWDTIIGRTFTEQPSVAYEKVGDKLTFQQLVNVDLLAAYAEMRTDIHAEALENEVLALASMNVINVRVNDEMYSLGLINGGGTPSMLRSGEKMGPRILSIEGVPEVSARNQLVSADEIQVDAVPFSAKPYRATYSERETIKQIVQEWKDNGIVTETTSLYASPVLLVKKEWWTEISDRYRRLNSQTERVNFPLPNIDEYLEIIDDAKVFAVLDLAHG